MLVDSYKKLDEAFLRDACKQYVPRVFSLLLLCAPALASPASLSLPPLSQATGVEGREYCGHGAARERRGVRGEPRRHARAPTAFKPNPQQPSALLLLLTSSLPLLLLPYSHMLAVWPGYTLTRLLCSLLVLQVLACVESSDKPRTYSVEQLTTDHQPTDFTERLRIQTTGAVVKCVRATSLDTLLRTVTVAQLSLCFDPQYLKEWSNQ